MEEKQVAQAVEKDQRASREAEKARLARALDARAVDAKALPERALPERALAVSAQVARVRRARVAEGRPSVLPLHASRAGESFLSQAVRP